MSKLIGYIVVGAGEADKMLNQALDDMERVVDDIAICLNNADVKTKKEIKKRGYWYIEDDREWGKCQNKIKENFIKLFIKKLKPDYCLAKDADEIFGNNLSKEKLIKYLDNYLAVHFWVCNLWDTGYAPDMCFWKVFAWKNVPEYGYKVANQALHCGLVPEWAGRINRYAPFVVFHYGLKDKKIREKKWERYQKYDPDGIYKSKNFYQSLIEKQKVIEFNQKEVENLVIEEVSKLNQSPVKINMAEKKYYLVKTPDGRVVDVEDRFLEHHLQQGCELIQEIGNQSGEKKTKSKGTKRTRKSKK